MVGRAGGGRGGDEVGAARLQLDIDEYRERLQRRFQASHGLIRDVIVKRARKRPDARRLSPRATTCGSSARPAGWSTRASRSPILVGGERISERPAVGYRPLDGVEVVDPRGRPTRATGTPPPWPSCAAAQGDDGDAGRRGLLDPDLFAVMMVRQGDADAVLGGLPRHTRTRSGPRCSHRLEQGRSIAAAHLCGGRLEASATSSPTTRSTSSPTAEELAEIAVSAAAVARDQFDVNPRVGFISYSNFGSAAGEEPARVRRAVEMCAELRPGLAVDGEMHADTAVVARLLERRKPGSRLGGRSANVLVFPNLTAANASYKLLNRLGDAEVIGPILTGLARSVHILQLDADVGDVVNLTAIAVIDADRKQRVEAPTG